MARNYDHKEIEKKWQKNWSEEKLYETPDSAPGKENLYALVEFPYPSGDLHVGHWYAFSIPDMYVRMKRMQGKNVLFPMGFDAFGLPAENAAIKRNINPADWINESVLHMRTQMKSMGNAFDWSREITTSSPEYLKWTQWLFLKFYENGLAYRKEAKVNWCPEDQTVLANEQVIEGKCERCGTDVVQKEMKQWFMKITDYADRLLDDLEPLDWPNAIKESQRNWIGRSEGAEINFELRGQGLEEVKRIVLLHGYTGTPNRCWFPWLKRELESRDYEVQAPQLPNSPSATVEEQVEYALKHCTFDESTIVIGHSLGGVVALRLLERGVKIAKLVLVATPSSGNYLDKKERPTVTEAIQKGFNAKKIKDNTKNIVLLYDSADDVVAVSDGGIFAQLFGVPITQKKAISAHFAAEQEPDVLASIIPSVSVFTTRPDTLFGVSFLVLAPEHPLIQEFSSATSNYADVKKYVEDAKKKAELTRMANKEKTGVLLEGVRAINPATKEEIPVFVADYVLGGYGTGAVMGVPGHDERDNEFAKKYDVPIPVVIEGGKDGECYEGNGKLVNSGGFTGLANEEAKQKITEHVGGRMTKTYKFRDWLISRQRYWGAPIPIVYDPEGKAHPIPEEHLPWLLPKDADIKPKGTSPLGSSRELLERTEKLFGKGWRPETDTMDGFVDNSWYFFRYLDSKNSEEFSSLKKQKQWMPIARYSGGAEHTTVHVLYSRFFTKALFDMGLATVKEPYSVRMNRGIILAEDGRKMSKRWGNVVNPDEQVENVGADAVRTYLAFIGPYNEVGSFPWSTNGLIGVRRFLERVAEMGQMARTDTPSLDETLLHQSIKKIGDDIESFKFNTSVSQLMILSNHYLKQGSIPKEAYETFLKLLAPFAPHLSEELWHEMGHTGSIHLEGWPAYDASKLETQEVTLAVQIGGKVRGTISISRTAPEEEAISLARGDPKLKTLIPEEPKKIVYVPGRILNFVA